VTSQLVAQRLTAAMIAALDITTSRLTVTSGAKIGNFSIADGWLKADNSGQAAFIDLKSLNSRILLGRMNRVTGYSDDGTPLYDIRTSNTGVIHNTSKGTRETHALELRAAGDANVKAIALDASGGIRVRGGTVFVEEIAPLNTDVTGSPGEEAENIAYYRCFVFQSSTSAAQNIILPPDWVIANAFGYFETGYAAADHAFITVKILVTRFSSGPYNVIAGSSSTPLIDRDGNTVSSIQLKKGNFAEFTYCNRAWYLSAKN
jgi:hypothetical protein